MYKVKIWIRKLNPDYDPKTDAPADFCLKECIQYSKVLTCTEAEAVSFMHETELKAEAAEWHVTGSAVYPFNPEKPWEH